MEFLQLTYFCRAAELENFAQVAREFKVPATSVAQSVGRLEKELGRKLFSRSANGIKLNSQGKSFYHSVKNSMNILNDAKSRIKEDKISGTIKLLVVCAYPFVKEVITSFKEKYENVDFEIDYLHYENPKQYDLIITDNITQNDEFTAFRLLIDKINIVVSKNNPLADKGYISVSDFKKEKLVVTEEETGLYAVTKRICLSNQIEPRISIRSNMPEHIISYIEKGFGIGLVPSITWKSLFTDNICLKEFGDDFGYIPTKHLFVCFDKYQYMPKVVKTFWDELKEKAAQYIQAE